MERNLKRKRTANEFKVEWHDGYVETDSPKSHNETQNQKYLCLIKKRV